MEQVTRGCVFVPRRVFYDALGTAPTQGNRILEPFESIRNRTQLPGFLVETVDILSEAEIHMALGDLWMCISGKSVFIVGGDLVDGKQRRNSDGSEMIGEFFSSAIQDGE